MTVGRIGRIFDAYSCSGEASRGMRLASNTKYGVAKQPKVPDSVENLIHLAGWQVYSNLTEERSSKRRLEPIHSVTTMIFIDMKILIPTRRQIQSTSFRIFTVIQMIISRELGWTLLSI